MTRTRRSRDNHLAISTHAVYYHACWCLPEHHKDQRSPGRIKCWGDLDEKARAAWRVAIRKIAAGDTNPEEEVAGRLYHLVVGAYRQPKPFGELPQQYRQPWLAVVGYLQGVRECVSSQERPATGLSGTSATPTSSREGPDRTNS